MPVQWLDPPVENNNTHQLIIVVHGPADELAAAIAAIYKWGPDLVVKKVEMKPIDK